MNYADKFGVDMCRIWFYLLRRFNPEARVTVFHAGQVGKIAEYAARFGRVEFVRLDMAGISPHGEVRGYAVPSQELILAMWRHIDRDPGYRQHLFIEADALVLTPLDELWGLSSTKPYVSFEELVWKDGLPLINTGVHTYYSTEGFVSYNVLMEQLRIDGGEILMPVGEQGLVNRYFRRIGYDCTHPAAGFEWNCWAVSSVTERAEDDEIVVISGDQNLDRWPGPHPWRWWGKRRRAKILHAFMVKFWDLPECSKLWEYCLRKVNSL
jgi:hypothetical protein